MLLKCFRLNKSKYINEWKQAKQKKKKKKKKTINNLLFLNPRHMFLFSCFFFSWRCAWQLFLFSKARTSWFQKSLHFAICLSINKDLILFSHFSILYYFDISIISVIYDWIINWSYCLGLKLVSRKSCRSISQLKSFVHVLTHKANYQCKKQEKVYRTGVNRVWWARKVLHLFRHKHFLQNLLLLIKKYPELALTHLDISPLLYVAQLCTSFRFKI